MDLGRVTSTVSDADIPFSSFNTGSVKTFFFLDSDPIINVCARKHNKTITCEQSDKSRNIYFANMTWRLFFLTGKLNLSQIWNLSP